MMKGDYPGKGEIFEAYFFNEGSYDVIFKEYGSFIHIRTPMSYWEVNNPRQIHNGAIDETKNVFNSFSSSTVKIIQKKMYIL